MQSRMKLLASGFSSTRKTRFSVASKAAHILRGKHKPTYTPHVDTGDFVVIINADKIRVTGKKLTDKEYYRHSGYPGGLKCETFEEAMEKHPERVIEEVVQGYDAGQAPVVHQGGEGHAPQEHARSCNG